MTDHEGDGRRQDLIATSALLLLGVGVAGYSFFAPWSHSSRGPEIMPRVAATTIAVGAALTLIRALIRAAPEPESWRFSIAVIPPVIAIVYIYAIRSVGFVVSTAVFLLVAFFATGAGRWQRRILLTVGLTAVLYGFFVRAMSIYIPSPWLF